MRSLVNQMLSNRIYNGAVITPTHVFGETLSNDEVKEYLKSYGSDIDALQEEIDSLIDLRPNSRVPAVLTVSVTTIIETAEKVTKERMGDNVEVDFKTFLFCLIHNAQETGDTDVVRSLEKSGFNFDKFLADFEKKKKQSLIEELCLNLNQEAKDGKIDPVIGRDDDVLKTIEILCKRKKNNAVLLGKAGVGKTAIAEAIALSVVNGIVPEQLKNMVVLSLEVANMVAGTAFRGQFEEKILGLIKEIQELEASGKMPVLFIDELHSIVGSGNTNGLDFANIIKPALSRGKLRCVGATTDAEWQKFINSDKALKRRFSQVNIEEPTREQTIDILKGAKKYYEEKHGVTYSDEAIVRTVDLSMEFINETALPDKSLDLMDLTGSILKLKGHKEIGVSEVESSICRMKSLSLEAVRSKKTSSSAMTPMNPRIKENLFGQDQAVDDVVKVVEKSLAGMQDDSKPMGQFLFIGPTGVGKTELAKLLASEMKAHLERIDMSEFMEAHSVAKLIGAPPGYVGFDQQGRLQKAINKHPRCVLLLDEVEKAHPRILDIFLQAMDNAKVTDSQGEEIKFNNVLILMTSNTGAREMNERTVGLAAAKFEEKKINQNAIKDSFTPEFLNRLSGVVEFKSLSKDYMVNIVKKFAKKVNDKLVNKGVTLELSNEAEMWIVEKTYDPTMGGRPIERGVDKYITQKITESILYGDLKNGKTQVKVVVENDELKFEYA